MHKSFVVLSSKSDSDATVRLQSEAVQRGLEQIPGVSVIKAEPSADLQIQKGACVLFHFDDLPAIASLQRCGSTGLAFSAACFGSDIYEFSRYLPSYQVADLYLMPTAMHTKILASQFYKPVYHLAEGIDSIALDGQEQCPGFPAKQSRRVLWFGYSQSFNKGMASLVPILKMHLGSGSIQDFSLILDQDDFTNDFNLPTLPYSNDSFRAQARAFDYCILSHFSLDLSLNSYIKSPNKLVTALMAGLIPIASDTPAYSEILGGFGLERFLFDSPTRLDQILRTLDPPSDSQQIVDSGILESLWTTYSAANLAKGLLAILDQFQARTDDELTHLPLALAPRKQRSIYFTEHMRDLLPSFSRAVKNRLTKSNRPA